MEETEHGRNLAKLGRCGSLAGPDYAMD